MFRVPPWDARERLADTPFDRPPARATPHNELVLRQAKGVLNVDKQEGRLLVVFRRGPDRMLGGPGPGLASPVFVRHPEDPGGGSGIEELGRRKRHPSVSTKGCVTRPEGSLG